MITLSLPSRPTAHSLIFHVQYDTLQTQGLTNFSIKHLMGFTHLFINHLQIFLCRRSQPFHT